MSRVAQLQLTLGKLEIYCRAFREAITDQLPEFSISHCASPWTRIVVELVLNVSTAYKPYFYSGTKETAKMCSCGSQRSVSISGIVVFRLSVE